MTLDTQSVALPLGTAPLTVAQYLALGEDPPGLRLELQEGNIVVSSSPKARHMVASGALFSALTRVAPDGVKVIFELDVDLQLAPPDGPGTVRRTDLIVLTGAEYDRSVSIDEAVRAVGVRLAIEIMSPGSRRTDLVVKRAEYADAGIEQYWVIDLDDGPALTAFRRNHEGGYDEATPVRAMFSTEQPFPLTLDLDTLA